MQAQHSSNHFLEVNWWRSKRTFVTSADWSNKQLSQSADGVSKGGFLSADCENKQHSQSSADYEDKQLSSADKVNKQTSFHLAADTQSSCESTCWCQQTAVPPADGVSKQLSTFPLHLLPPNLPLVVFLSHLFFFSSPSSFLESLEPPSSPACRRGVIDPSETATAFRQMEEGRKEDEDVEDMEEEEETPGGGGGKRKEKFANARSLQKSREFPLISNVNSFPSAHKNPLPSDVAAFLGRDLLVVVYSIHPCSWEERKTGEKRFYFLRNRRRRRQQKKAGCNLICWGSRRKIDDRETPSVRPPHIRRRRRLCEDLPEGEGEEKRGEATTGTAKLRPWRKWWEKK